MNKDAAIEVAAQLTLAAAQHMKREDIVVHKDKPFYPSYHTPGPLDPLAQSVVLLYEAIYSLLTRPGASA